MAKKKRKAKSAAPRKKLTSERPLKNRPVDNDEPTPPDQESGEATGDEEESLVTVETPRTRKGRQPRLPGTEDPEIEELEDLAQQYADVRDQRMALTPQETKLKADLLAEMKKRDRTSYNHAGITIKVVHEKETVKVKVNKAEEE